MSFSYAVVLVGAEWKVVGARRAMGHFASRDLALVAAGNLAREAFLAGHRVEVLLQSESGELVACGIGDRPSPDLLQRPDRAM